MSKSSPYRTTQLITNILKFSDNRQVLSQHFQSPAMDWDAMVVIGSQHLMLPAIYCRLQDKGLLYLLPKDLTLYLAEITQINRNRNKILLEEAQDISRLFDQASIAHVFIKGIALVAQHAFNDPAERMIGDLDIVVAPQQLQQAFDLLAAQGYTHTVEFNYQPQNYRHLPRQFSEQKIGAVELHSDILAHKYTRLLPGSQVLQTRQNINGLYVTGQAESIKTAIYALQINDKAYGMGYCNLKTIYDVLSLHLDKNDVILRTLSEETYARSFLHLASVFVEDLKPVRSSSLALLLQRYLIFRLQYPKIGQVLNSFMNILQQGRERIHLFHRNKSYRKHIIRNKLLGKKS